MIEETGTVVGIFESEIVVEVLRTSACQTCSAKQGCGQAVLAEWGDASKQQQKNHFKLPFHEQANIGDLVDLGMEHDTVTKVAMIVYAIPLIFGFAGLLLGYAFRLSESFQLLLLCSFFALSFLFMSRLNFNKSSVLEPKILRLYPRSKGVDLIVSTSSKSL